MAKKASAKSQRKSKAAQRKAKAAPKKTAAPKKKVAVRATVLAGAAAPANPVIAQIVSLAANSGIAGHVWPGRGVAPLGYTKGMAVSFARAHCKLLAGDAVAVEMAKADTEQPDVDALSRYAPEFQALGFSNDVAGADTLRHLFVLLIGLGMRESSGKHCEGRDTSANNKTGETAEAGLFQVSFDARSSSPLLPPLFATYRANPSGFVDVFHEGVNCTAVNLKNWGTGDGVEFQRLMKACPTFAAEFSGVALRRRCRHWGPIKRKEAQVLRDCDTMLRDVENFVAATAGACAALQ